MTKFLDEGDLSTLAKEGRVDPATIQALKQMSPSEHAEAQTASTERMLIIMSTLLKQLCQGHEGETWRQEKIMTLLQDLVQKPTHSWKFKILRNHEGFIKEVAAERVEAQKWH